MAVEHSKIKIASSYEPRSEKIGLRGFRPGPTQTGLYSFRRLLEARNFGFRKKRDCTIYVAKTKALISFCVFVFAYAKIRFSHIAAHIKTCLHAFQTGMYLTKTVE